MPAIDDSPVPPDHAITAQSLEALTAQLSQLQTQNAQRFNPVRFRFITAMATRAAGLTVSVQQRLVDKANRALADYLCDLHQARARAEQSLQTLSPPSPEAQLLFSQGDYRAVLTRVNRLTTHAPLAASDALRNLCRHINNQQPLADTAAEHGPALDQVLLQQEQTLQQALLTSVATEAPTHPTQPAPVELRAARRFRQSQGQHNIHKVVSKAFNEQPESPGPLNPHMLALRALGHMRELSPHYLNRFVAHAETLLWLEQAESKLARKQSSKKPAVKKSAGGTS